jgi:hypothetical protein
MSYFNELFENRRHMFHLYERALVEKFMGVKWQDENKENLGFVFSSNSLRENPLPTDPVERQNRMIDDLNVANLCATARELGINACIETYCFGRMVIEGPKLFKPNRLNLEALENLKVTIPIEDYVQPFPTIVIEFPPEYSKRLAAPNPVHGEHLYFSAENTSDIHDPKFVILHFDKQLMAIFVAIYFSSNQIFSSFLWRKTKDDYNTLEEILNYLMNLEVFDKSLAVDPKEQEVAHRIIRMALNCALTIDELGSKKIGPVNQNHYNRLERHSKNKDRRKAKAARDEMRQMPVLYSFDQEIKFYKTDVDLSGPKIEKQGGYTLRPHWRSGYYKMQPYGKNNSLRKRIRIDSVLVNKHLFSGENKDTTYTKEI